MRNALACDQRALGKKGPKLTRKLDEYVEVQSPRLETREFDLHSLQVN